MRLHQRVGRLNRYGQAHPVEIVTVRNPDTVESRIWGKLEQKLGHIMQALGHARAAMDTLRLPFRKPISSDLVLFWPEKADYE